MQRDAEDVFSRVRPDQLNWIIRNNPQSLAIVLDAGIDVSGMSAWELERHVGMVNRIDVLRGICSGDRMDSDEQATFFHKKLDEAIRAWQDTIEEHAIARNVKGMRI
jgi:hypothetical protein